MVVSASSILRAVGFFFLLLFAAHVLHSHVPLLNGVYLQRAAFPPQSLSR